MKARTYRRNCVLVAFDGDVPYLINPEGKKNSLTYTPVVGTVLKGMSTVVMTVVTVL
jgi:hypothetical protein